MVSILRILSSFNYTSLVKKINYFPFLSHNINVKSIFEDYTQFVRVIMFAQKLFKNNEQFRADWIYEMRCMCWKLNIKHAVGNK